VLSVDEGLFLIHCIKITGNGSGAGVLSGNNKKIQLMSRSSGVLLHITSLPSKHGIGDLGREAYRFADFLVATKQKYWQILPLTPIEDGLGNSPYSSVSAFAGNTLLISLYKLAQEGLLETSDIESYPDFGQGKVDYPLVRNFKEPMLDKAFHNFELIKDRNLNAAFDEFCSQQQSWLNDFALFKALKLHFHNKSWDEWDDDIKNRASDSVNYFTQLLEKEIKKEKFFQFIFRKQWEELKKYCHERNIRFIGDMPIYVNYDSLDVWINYRFFKLDEYKKPLFVAGTPPDYFSKTGQLWGNPVYNWEILQQDGFKWWISRIEQNFALFDLVRLDHFLGFVNYFEIDADAPDAIGGKWVNAPAEDFFQTLLHKHPNLPIIAEDLGTLSQAVIDFIEKYNFPGMKVLQFAFGDDMQKNPYLPHNHIKNSVVYTGTHDNSSTRGWWRTEASSQVKHNFGNYAGYWIDESNVTDAFCKMAVSSVADTVILPMQDILDLDESSRMNVPGIAQGNWSWRLHLDYSTDTIIQRLIYYTEASGRI
jgi:4-alpha-glucanotransferase